MMTEVREGLDPAKVEDFLREELARGDAALARTETKASMLLAVFSPIVTVGLALLPGATTPLPALLAFWAALTLLATALLLLLWSVRPRLRGSGFAVYGTLSDAELAERITDLARDPQRWHRERLLAVVRLGAKKFRLLRVATNLIIAALLCAIAAGVVAASA